MSVLTAFLPEWVVLAGALALFVTTLGPSGSRRAYYVALATAVLVAIAAAFSLSQSAVLFDGAYRVDQFSQVLKLVLALGFTAVVVISGRLPDVRTETKPEYFLFLTLSASGLLMLVSCVDIITLVIALELSSFPLYFMVALRRELGGHRMQMESAIKYVMFGVAANGTMLFGISYLFGLTGTTSLPLMVERLQPLATTPIAVVGLALSFAGFYYKLAVFPFHFWTPDVYEGASNETTAVIASLPKLAAGAVLVRLVSMATPENTAIVALLTGLALASMFYGNLLALGQRDLKRLLGFSGIAHAGYAVVGLVSLSEAGFAATLYYLVCYITMVLACFVVITRVARDGGNVGVEDVAGLHRRSPLLAVTLVVGLFGLAGLPPLGGFMGKLSILTAALAQGHLMLVVFTMINAAIAIYYYLRVVREAVFGEAPAEAAPIALDGGTRVLCVVLVVAILALGLMPSLVLETLNQAVAAVNLPLG
jgi:NADH-quinone oxidoreductase subunit N